MTMVIYFYFSPEYKFPSLYYFIPEFKSSVLLNW